MTATETNAAGETPRNPSDIEYVFEPHSVKLPPVRHYFQDLWGRRRFMMELAKSDLRGTRSNAALGQFWAVLDPIFQAAIYWFLITVIRGGAGGRGSAEQLTVLIASVFLFNYTRIALNDGGRSIINGKGLLLNSTFPRALLPIAQVYKGMLEMVPSGAIYLVIHLALQRPIGQGIVLLPFLFAIQTAMNLGMALIVATLTVYIRDVANLLTYITRVLIFVTPVIYPVSMLTPNLRRFLQWNPLFPLFAAYQEIVAGRMPGAGMIIQSALWATFFLVVGTRFFMSHERAFALRL